MCFLSDVILESDGKMVENCLLTKTCPTAWSYSMAQYVNVAVITKAFPVAWIARIKIAVPTNQTPGVKNSKNLQYSQAN